MSMIKNGASKPPVNGNGTPWPDSKVLKYDAGAKHFKPTPTPQSETCGSCQGLLVQDASWKYCPACKQKEGKPE